MIENVSFVGLDYEEDFRALNEVKKLEELVMNFIYSGTLYSLWAAANPSAIDASVLFKGKFSALSTGEALK